jgi:type I restriction enzyme, S subunit
LMQDLLTCGIDENGNIRNRQTHKFTVKNGIEVPDDWEVESFKDLCILIKDGTHLPPKRVEEGIWLLGVTNIISGEWRLASSDTKVSQEFYEQMHKFWQIEPSDVLLAIVGATIGKVTQVPKAFTKFTLQRSVCILRGKSNVLSNDFLRLFIESPYFYRALWNEVNVTAQPGIYLDTIGKFLLPLPNYDEQLLIVKKLHKQNDLINRLKESLAKLQAIKKGLMQDLLSGRRRVSEK